MLIAQMRDVAAHCVKAAMQVRNFANIAPFDSGHLKLELQMLLRDMREVILPLLPGSGELQMKHVESKDQGLQARAAAANPFVKVIYCTVSTGV